MVATHVKKIQHSVLCVTGVYLRDIMNIIFVISHLDASHLSICSSCCGMEMNVMLNTIYCSF